MAKEWREWARDRRIGVRRRSPSSSTLSPSPRSFWQNQQRKAHCTSPRVTGCSLPPSPPRVRMSL